MERTLGDAFFARPATVVALELLGKVVRRRLDGLWLSARIVECEAYELRERASHASLGRTPSREPLFMPPGTVYMYHSRGGPSFNVSVGEPGDAVLVKAGVPHLDLCSGEAAVAKMSALCPRRDGTARPRSRLCAGQTLLARALALEVQEWSGRPLDRRRLRIDDVGYRPASVLLTPRLGIPAGRDEHLFYRYVDERGAKSATKNPLTARGATEGVHYRRLELG